MKRSYICLLLLLCLVKTGMAQDQLIRKDSSVTLVKLVEINTSEIKYRRYDSPAGPIYTEKRESVSRIVHENGLREIITPAPPVKKYEPENESDKKAYYNNLSINILNFCNAEIGITYQRMFLKNRFSVFVPLSLGLSKPVVTQFMDYDFSYYDYVNYSTLRLNRKQFDAGLGINFYPAPRAKLKYFVGAVVKYMQFDATQNYSYNSDKTGAVNYVYISQDISVRRYCAGVNTGFSFRTRSGLTLGANVAMGYKQDKLVNPITDPITSQKASPRDPEMPFIWVGLNVGYDF